MDEAGSWPVLMGDAWSETSFNYGSIFEKLSKYSFNVTFPVTMSELKLGEPEETSSTGVSFNLHVDVSLYRQRFLLRTNVTNAITLQLYFTNVCYDTYMYTRKYWPTSPHVSRT